MRTTRTASSALRERARRRGRAEGPLRAAEVPRTVVGGENGRRAGLCAKRQRSTETGAAETPELPCAARGFRLSNTAQNRRKSRVCARKNGVAQRLRIRCAYTRQRKADRLRTRLGLTTPGEVAENCHSAIVCAVAPGAIPRNWAPLRLPRAHRVRNTHRTELVSRGAHRPHHMRALARTSGSASVRRSCVRHGRAHARGSMASGMGFPDQEGKWAVEILDWARAIWPKLADSP